MADELQCQSVVVHGGVPLGEQLAPFLQPLVPQLLGKLLRVLDLEADGEVDLVEAVVIVV